MSSHEPDQLTETGAFRVWRGGLGASAVRNWLNRAQPANPRHAAITNQLSNFPNYRSWADKVNHSWHKDED
jgi:hypothetical protein